MQYSQYDGINIGSGQHYREGWWNTDITPTDKGTQPDQLIDIMQFPREFPHKAFKKAYVGHVLEHIYVYDLSAAIQAIAHTAETVMVVGPCLYKAQETQQPASLIDAIKAPITLDDHPWSHKWTPTTAATAAAITQAGYKPIIVDVADVAMPEWPNPTTAPWQCAMWFTT